jgi:hypothetical protein
MTNNKPIQKEKKETINIDGNEYILKEEYDKLKLEQKEIKLQEYLISNDANIMAIVPVNRDTDAYSENTKEINIHGLGKYKKFEQEVMYARIVDKFPDIFILSNSRFSYEALRKAYKVYQDFNYENKKRFEPEFFLQFADEKIVENKPCLIKFENMIFVLAPRVED